MPEEIPSSPSLKHELRTPLNHIIGFCEMLIEEAEDEPSESSDGMSFLVTDLRRIHGAGRRLLGVIDDLFDESIPEVERLDESRIHHEVRTPLNQIIGYTELLEEEATERGIEVCVSDLQKIHGAAHRLLGLVMAHFGSARVETVQPKSEEQVERESRDEVRSSAPVVEPGSTAIHVTGEILVVDDDAGNREMLSRRLQRLGHSVSMTSNGREAIEMIRRGRFDLLLLDIIMPEVSGFQVLEYLCDNPPASALPVIVLSASDESSQVARCIEMGAEDYLPKPFDPALLRARIHSSMEKKQLRDREVKYLQAIEEEKEHSDDLLHVILPNNIAAELKATGGVRPRRIDDVAVLFADVVGFTSYCETRDPETVHRELQALVKAMESLTAGHGMEKIKTIGDAFLSTAGLLNRFGNPAVDCVRCGLAMIEKAARLPTTWQLRVGVQVGPVVAGIVGRQRYQYDIWGDTVNAAARMQSEADPGKLCVGSETWKLLEPYCEGRSLGVREIKGKGKQEVFEVSEVR